MASLALAFDILARDNASPTLRRVGNEAERTGTKIKGLGASVSGGMEGATRAVARFGSTFSTAATVIAGAGIVRGIGAVVSAASNAEQSVGGVQAVFKRYASTVIADSRAADRALGLSANSYRELATVIGSQLKNAQVPLQEIGNRTQGIIQIGADLAAQFGGSTQEAVQALSSAFRGELDPIERYGISLSAARVQAKAVELGLASGTGALSQNAKMMATLALITEQSADAQGAFAREADTSAGRAQRAAAQWENLKVAIGDHLLPAWSNLMDFAGSTVIPVMGEVVDAVAAAVGWFTDLPASLQIAGAAAGVWAIAGDRILGILRPMGGLLSSAAGTWRAFGEALSYARANGDGLGTVLRSVGDYAGGRTLSAVRALGQAIGPELAVAAGAFIITEFVDGIRSLTQASSEAKAAAEGLAGALTLTDQAADRRTIRQTIEDVDGLVEALSGAGVSARDAVDGLLGQEDAQRRVTRALQEYMATRRTAQTGGEAAEVREAMLAYEELATGYGSAAASARFFSEESQTAAGSSQTAEAAAGGLTSALDANADAANNARQQTSLYQTALDLLSGKTVDMIQVESQFQEALDRANSVAGTLNGTIIDQAGNLDLNNESARKVADVLLGVRDSGNQLIATMRQQGATEEQVRAKDAQLRASFIDTARQMGIGQQQAEKLADDILGIPSSRTTQINADTTQARRQINGLVNDYRGYTINLGLSANFNRFAAAEGGVLPGFTPGRDVHRFMSASGMQLDLSGGESIMRPEWTRAVGSHFVGRMNKLARTGGTAAVRSAMGFAAGGTVPADWLGGMLFRTGINAGSIASARSGMQDFARQFGSSASSLPGPGGPVQRWAGLVAQVLGILGQPSSLVGAVLQLIQHESGGNPRAINLWDINAQRGTPSIGLMQTIGPTFNAYAGPYRGRGIYDPLANIYAGLNYGMSRYGSVSNIPGIASLASGGRYRPYDNGGWLEPGYTLAYNGTGKPERVVGPNEGQSITVVAQFGSETVRAQAVRVVRQNDYQQNVRKRRS